MQWLLDTGLIYKSFNISTPKIPLDAYANTNIFKVFLLDIGLLGAMSRLSADTLIKRCGLKMIKNKSPEFRI